MADLDGTPVADGTLAIPAALETGGPPAPLDTVNGRTVDTWLPALPTTQGADGSDLAAVNNPVEIRSDAGLAAGIAFHEINNRLWTAGTRGSDGGFAVIDETGGTWRYFISTAGAHSINGNLSASSHISASGVIYGNAIHSWGNHHADGNIRAESNITASGHVISGNWASINGLQLGALWGDGWFGTNGSFRVGDLQSSTDISAGGSLVINGIWVQNYASRAYTGSELRGGYLRADWDMHVASNIDVANDANITQAFVNGCQIYGMRPGIETPWWWELRTPQPFQSVGNLTCTVMRGEDGLTMGYGIHTTLGAYWWTFHWNGIGYYQVHGLTSWHQMTNHSDERRKTDIAPSTFDCLATVRQLTLHQFRWKPCPVAQEGDMICPRHSDSVTPVGFLAQEVYKVFPAGVFKGDDNRDIDADPRNSFEWALDTNIMLALLTGSVQQLTRRLTAYEASHA